jgi:hypothetical protein
VVVAAAFHVVLVAWSVIMAAGTYLASLDSSAPVTVSRLWFLAMPMAFAYAGRTSAGLGQGYQWAQLAAWVAWIIAYLR